MRCLERNKTEFYYALYNGKQPVTDDDGYETGEYTISYSEPIKCKGNISQSTGRANTEQFGIDVSYDKVLVMDDVNTPIAEDSILWIDAAPTGKHNYIVKKIAKSLNSVSIALSRVDVK